MGHHPLNFCEKSFPRKSTLSTNSADTLVRYWEELSEAVEKQIKGFARKIIY